MLKHLWLALLLTSSIARAQVTTPPLRIYSGGTLVSPVRFKLNFAGGATAIDNAGAGRTDVTVSAMAGGQISDSPILGDGSAGNHLRCPTCITGTPTAIGDILYSTLGAQSMTPLADVAVNNVLLSGGVAAPPAWGKVANAALTNSSVTVASTSPLAGGGVVSLGGTLTLTCTTCISGTPTATGDLVYSTAGGTAVSPLADVAAGSFLRSGGVAAAPLWSTTTWPNSATTGDLVYASGSNAISTLADVATTNALISGGVGVAPNWGKIGNSTLSNSSVTINTTSPLGGGGSLSLGGTLTLTCTTCGTVTSVALSLPSFITVSGSPVTTSGTLSGTLATQTANTLFAGPSSGAAAAPTFRAFVNGDLPTSGATAGSYVYNTVNAQGIVTAGSNTVSSAPVFAAGATASGATAFDLSGSTAAEKTTTGAFTVGASSTTFTNGVTTSSTTTHTGSVAFNGGATASGSTDFDLSGSTGKIKSGGTIVAPANGTVDVASGTMTIGPSATSVNIAGVTTITSGGITFNNDNNHSQIGSASNRASNLFTVISTANHVVGAGSAPTTTVGTAAQLGTGPTCTIIKGTDTGGVVRVTSGTGPSAFTVGAAGAITACTVNYSNSPTAYGAAPTAVKIDPASANSAVLVLGTTGIAFYVDQASNATGSFVVKAVAAGITPALAASTAYDFTWTSIQ